MFTLICGLPNSGKTTYSSKFNNVIHFDDVDLKKIDEIISSADGDLCVEGLFITSRHRKKLNGLYKGNRTQCIWIDTPLDVCIKRENRNRCTDIIRNCNAFFQPPVKDEGWDEIIRIKNG